MKSLRLSLAACFALLCVPALPAADGSLQFTAASQQRVEVPNFEGLGISTAATVEEWNQAASMMMPTEAQTFPDLIVARMFEFRQASLLEFSAEQKRDVDVGALFG